MTGVSPLRWAGGPRHSEAGSATVEFVVLFPVLMLMMISSIEAAVMMTRVALLDRGLNLAVRELRLGTGNPPSFAEFRDAICDGAGLLAECASTLQVELKPVSTATWELLDEPALCIDRTAEINPLTEAEPEHYQTGLVHHLMIVRACYVADPIVPTMGLGATLPKDASGGYRLIATSAFMQEPSNMATGW